MVNYFKLAIFNVKIKILFTSHCFTTQLINIYKVLFKCFYFDT